MSTLKFRVLGVALLVFGTSILVYDLVSGFFGGLLAGSSIASGIILTIYGKFPRGKQTSTN